jgi:hypothetical protein
VKLTSADVQFSWCVRERADWKCERCGTHYPPPTKALHCAHFIPRGHWAVRLDPANAFCLCYGCHRYFDNREHQAEFEAFFIEKRGEEALRQLRCRDIDLVLAKFFRRTNGEGEIVKFYQSELERMKFKRLTSSVDRLEFACFSS